MATAASGPRLRDVNRVAVLALVGRHGPISRAEIARRLGLSPPTVTAVTRSLIETGVLQKVDDTRDASEAPPTSPARPMRKPSGTAARTRTDDGTRGGRPGELLAVVGSAALALGVKVAAGRITGVRADLDGQVQDTFSAPFDPPANNPFEAIAELVAPHLAADGADRLLGVGLGVPGFVDRGTGLVEAPLLGWRRLPLVDYLTRLLGLPVLVDNDVNTLAAYEQLYGLGRAYDDFLTITLGRGVGAAVVCGGDLRRGGHGAAGELGHLPVAADGPACHCGKRGCLETFIADRALLDQAAAAGVTAAGPAQLLAAAQGGEPAVREIYRVAGARLGTAAAGLATVLDPQAVLVSGEGTRAWEYLAGGFEPAFRDGLFPPLAGEISVHIDPWDDTKWALGAAALVLRAPFTAALSPDPQAEAARARLAAFSGAGAAG